MHLLLNSSLMCLALLLVIAQSDILGDREKSLRFFPSRQESYEETTPKTDQDLSASLYDITCDISTLKSGLFKVDCSHRGIVDISKLNLSHPERVAELNLKGNFIQDIPVGSWTLFKNLTNLNLDENRLSRLENDTFHGLSKLEWLSLQGNGLAFTRQNFPEAVFTPLRALKVLHLRNNTGANFPGRSASNRREDEDFPDWALSRLTSLETLYIDGLPNTSFGPGFRNLTHLKHVSMNGHFGYCNLSILHAAFLDNVRQIERLDMQYCGIRLYGIELGVLRHMHNLRRLDVSRNVDLDLDGLTALLISQINSTKLTRLSANMIINPFSMSRCVSNELARKLPRSLTSIDAASNNLETVSDQVFELLPKNLSYLNLDNNRFFFGSYLRNMSLMRNLQILKLNGFPQGFSLPTYFSAVDQQPVLNCTSSTKGKSEKIVFKLPPKLELLFMTSADLSLTISKFSVHPNNSLKTIIMHRNNFPFLTGPVSGLNKVEHLDLSRNNIEFISHDFFLHWNIQTLNLSQNDFNSYLNKRTFNVSFPRTLRSLDLSNTNVGYFSMDFSTLTNLEHLYLKNSRVRFPNLSLAKNIKLLDLSDNFLYMLRPSDTKAMNSFPNLTVDLSGNIIGCYCDTLDFIDWLVHYPRLKDKNLSQMFCEHDGVTWHVPDFRLEYQMFRRRCASQLELLFISTSVSVSLLLLIFVFIAYRYRWKLRFWYYSASLYVNSVKEQGEGQDFQTDVNIAYCEDDEDFAEVTLVNTLGARGLTVHVRGRDSKAGTYIFKEIVETVQTCRRTLVVLTPQMLSSKWCQATVNLAAQEAVSSGRKVLVFLVLEPVESHQLGATLLFLLQNSDIFFYPPEETWDDERAMGLFWRKLIRVLY